MVSLVALRTFVEVARLRSFKGAAQSLGVTTGAVSQQIKIVEQRFDVTLFERSSRDLRLTEHGVRLLDAIHVPFEQIREAVEDFHNSRPRRNTIRVITGPALAAHWLVPRLGSFWRRHPEIEVMIDTSQRDEVLRCESFDVAISYGPQHLHGFDEVKLNTSQLIVVGSPQLLDSGPPIVVPSDCLSFPLLHDRSRLAWATWCRANGLKRIPVPARQGLSFADDTLLITAAAASQGLALVSAIHAENFLEKGQLKVAIACSIEAFQSYYLITPERVAQKLHIQIFKEWLLAELDETSLMPLKHAACVASPIPFHRVGARARPHSMAQSDS